MKYDCRECEGAGEIERNVCGHSNGNCPCAKRVWTCSACDGTGQGPETCDLCQDGDALTLPGASICQGCVEQLAQEAREFRERADELEQLAREMVAGRMRREEKRALKLVGGEK